MGLTAKETERLYIGTYVDLFDEYKEIHNFNVNKLKYETVKERKKTSLLDL